MPDPSPALIHGREAYERREWRAAWESLTQADDDALHDDALHADDLWLLAVSAYLVGREAEFVAALERAHRIHQDADDPAAAAHCAFWIGFHLIERGEVARASGWFGRASRLLERADGDHVQRGYLLLPSAFQCLNAGDNQPAYRIGGDAAVIAERFGDRDLHALAVHIQGRALIRQARVPEGLALLDEAMVAVATGELSPPVTGLIYCSVIGACRNVYALGRAQEWIAALSDWCERQPDMVSYTGECRVYRAEIMQLRGAWDEAIDEARRAFERLTDDGRPAASLAHYQEAEVLRLQGEFAAAEEAYRAASRAGREPQPGLALLRLAQGDHDAAAAAIRRIVSETDMPLRRARLLPAHIEIMLAVGDTAEARRACAELEEIARAHSSGVLATLAAHACGAVELEADDPRAALPHLRKAVREWQALEAPYEVARARLLLGLACRALGDEDTSGLEIEAARAAFQRLGATPDVARVDALTGKRGRRGGRNGHGLTPRELEVLALVATGRTNRAIAEALFISEKTVARHLSNIFTKLGLGSRSAATAYAYEHDLVRPTG